MDPQRWQRIEQLYEAAEALDTGARTSLLERECAGDDDLRREVESLLAANKSAEGFLEKPAFIVQTPPPLRSLTDDLPASMVGRRLGAYHITGVIGSGGMGVVYLAEQDFPRRSVALKVVKPSLATPSMVRRFEHEAQILGRLHHPGIAQIYEAGAAPDHDNPIGSGVRAFFAMEYVKGRTITDFATTNNLSTNKKLELFSKVCDALQHAHQRGVIHRDLKPANILVDESALSAGHTDTTEAQPKILDFGVARLTDADRRVTTMRTSMGQLIGTLPYMSPEQVAGDQDNIDTRSDVYALGVVLYELLSGKLPHDLSARSIPEAARIIRDDEPVRLSSISRVFRGEIDTIVNKAIDKDRARRYQSASDLADDIRRYLRGEPIAAKRDSALYVLRKQLNRYRGAVAAAALFIVSLIVFAIVMFVQSRENQRLAAKAIAERERAVEALTLAESERARADRTSFRLADQLTASTIEHGRLAGLLGNAALAKDLLWPEFFRDPNSRHAYWALWEFYLREPCVWTLKPHSDYIPIALFTPDERTICSGSRDGTIAATDFATLTHLVTAPATEGAVVGMAMHPTGRFLVSAPHSGILQFWNPRTLEHLGCVNPRQGPLGMVAVNPEGNLLATGGADGSIKLWPITPDFVAGRTVEPLRSFFGHRRIVFGLTFGMLPDGRKVLASTSNDQTARIWDLETAEPITTIPLSAPFTSGVVFSADGSVLITGCVDRSIRAWDTLSGVMLWQQQRLNGTIRSVAWAPGRNELLLGGWYLIERIDAETGEPIGQPLGHLGRANSLRFTRDGRYVLSSSDDGTIRLWDSEPLAARTVISAGAAGTPGVLFDADDTGLITGSRAAEVRHWAIDETGVTKTVIDVSGQSRAIRLNPDRSILAVGTGTGEIELLDATCWKRIDKIRPNRYVIQDMAFTPDGNKLISLSGDGALVMTDLIDGRCVWSDQSFTAEPLRIAISPDGRSLAVTSREQYVRIYDVETGQCRARLYTQAASWSVTYSGDGSTLFVGDWSNQVKRWDAETLEELPPLRGHSQVPFALAAGPSGRLLASGSQDTTVKLWDVWSGKCLATLDGSKQEIIALAFSRDGRRLAAGRTDGKVDLWDLTYYRRHISGNAQFELDARAGNLSQSVDMTLLKPWLDAGSSQHVTDVPARSTTAVSNESRP